MDMVELNGIVEFRPPPERQLILTYELHRPRQILRHCSMYLESVLQSMWMDAQLHSALCVGTLNDYMSIMSTLCIYQYHSRLEQYANANKCLDVRSAINRNNLPYTTCISTAQ